MKKTLFFKAALAVAVSFSFLILMCMPAYAAQNITETQAKKIALKDAGVKEKDVILLRLELSDGTEDDEYSEYVLDISEDQEDAASEEGVSDAASEGIANDDYDAVTIAEPRYIIEFYHNGTLYEYAVDYATGEILSTVMDTEFFLNPGALPSSLP